MYARVIPAVRLPKNFAKYDYVIPEHFQTLVKRGSWVIVPWRGKYVDGLVTETLDRSEIDSAKLKKIAGFGSMAPINEDLLVIPERMAQHYFVSPASALKVFLPVTPKTKIITKVDEVSQSIPTLPELQSKEKLRLLQNYHSTAEKLSLILKFAATASKIGSVVIITPHSEEVMSVSEKISAALAPLPIIPFHGAMTASAQRQTWKEIQSKSQVVVIGTRLASFAPINNLALFIVLEAESGDLRQYDQNPRYDAREIARWRAESTGAGIIYLSQTFRSDEFNLTKSDFQFCSTSETKPETVLVDISGQPHNALPISPIVYEQAKKALQSGKKVLLYHNRHGLAGTLFCCDCHHVFRCSTCQTALTVWDNLLRCNRCGNTISEPNCCPNCNGQNLRRIGLGTIALAKLLQEEFPNSTIENYDSISSSLEERREALCRVDILIGARLLLHDITENGPDDCWGCVAAIETDSLLILRGFRARENAWRSIRLLKNIAAANETDLLLQTFDPNSPKIRQLLTDFTEFISTELQQRQATSYPPFGELITITIKADTSKLAVTQASDLRQRIETIIPGIKIAGPLQPNQPFRDGKWRSILVIKTPIISATLTELLKSLPEEFIIDRNPEIIG
jgi:primosomal protein N' (replication factor Y)